MDPKLILEIVFMVTSSSITIALVSVERPTDDEKKVTARFASLASSRTAGPVVGGDATLLYANDDSVPVNVSARALNYIAKVLKFERLLLQANSTINTPRLFGYCLGVGIGGALLLYVLLQNGAIAVLGALGCSYLPVVFLRIQRARRIAAFDISLPDAIEMMSRSLRAGHSMTAAISIVAEHASEPAKTEFSEVFRKQNFGLPLRDALIDLLDRTPSHDLRLLITGMLVQKDTGGNLAEILDRIVWVIRERLKIQGEIRIQTAQGRLTGWILCLMPIGLMIILNIINPGYSKPLTTDPLGIKILYGGIILLVFGAFLIKRIIDGIEV